MARNTDASHAQPRSAMLSHRGPGQSDHILPEVLLTPGPVRNLIDGRRLSISRDATKPYAHVNRRESFTSSHRPWWRAGGGGLSWGLSRVEQMSCIVMNPNLLRTAPLDRTDIS